MAPMFKEFLPTVFDAEINTHTGTAIVQGYHVPEGFSVMKALYCFCTNFGRSRVTSKTFNSIKNYLYADLLASLRAPSTVYLPPAAFSSIVTPNRLQYQILGDCDNAEVSKYDDGDYLELGFAFRGGLGSYLGGRAFLAHLPSDREVPLCTKRQVVLKLWDGWTLYPPKDDEKAPIERWSLEPWKFVNEARIYVHLKSLWAKWIPHLHVKIPLDFFHALIFQYVEVPSPPKGHYSFLLLLFLVFFEPMS